MKAVSTDNASSRSAVWTDWARTPSLNHVLFHLDHLTWAAGRWRVEIRTELDEDEILLPANWAVVRVSLAHGFRTCRNPQQNLKSTCLATE